jgi:pimeloyl-ACP methyl ester carboxylesterase
MVRLMLKIAPVAVALLGSAPSYSQAYRPFIVKTPDGVQVSAQEWGNPNGEELVFIHGFMQSHLSWSKQLHDPELSKKFRMISYDFRGHGASDKIMDAKFYNNGESFADELNAVIQASLLKKPILVGWSYGTRIISDYLVKYGSSKLGGIVFVGGVGNGDPKHFGSAMPLIPKSATEDLAQNIEVTKAFIRGCFEKQPTTEEFELMLAFNMMVPAKIRAWLRRPAPYEEALKRVSVPSLVIHGIEDRILGIGVGKYLVATVPGAKASFYEGVGHSPFWEDASRFNRELIEFMNNTK